MSQNGHLSTEGLVIDRTRITVDDHHRVLILGLELVKAQRDLDIPRMTELLAENKALSEKVIISVPAGWLPEGVTVETAGWYGKLPKVYADLIDEEMKRLINPGEKKVSDGS
jgi:hypothetical protein